MPTELQPISREHGKCAACMDLWFVSLREISPFARVKSRVSSSRKETREGKRGKKPPFPPPLTAHFARQKWRKVV